LVFCLKRAYTQAGKLSAFRRPNVVTPAEFILCIMNGHWVHGLSIILLPELWLIPTVSFKLPT
jgi:hypothetical protein